MIHQFGWENAPISEIAHLYVSLINMITASQLRIISSGILTLLLKCFSAYLVLFSLYHLSWVFGSQLFSDVLRSSSVQSLQVEALRASFYNENLMTMASGAILWILSRRVSVLIAKGSFPE